MVAQDQPEELDPSFGALIQFGTLDIFLCASIQFGTVEANGLDYDRPGLARGAGSILPRLDLVRRG